MDFGNVMLEHCNRESNACRDKLEMTTPTESPSLEIAGAGRCCLPIEQSSTN